MNNRSRARDKRIEHFREWLDYDPTTGVFTWIKVSGKGYLGTPAGTLTKKGYLAIGVRGVLVPAHRLAWLWGHGQWPSDQIDHINGNKTDNRLSNLREATNQQNHFNRGPQKNSTTGVKGVYWFKPNRQWKAQIVISGRSTVLGYFHDFDQAVACRKEAEERLHGDWAHRGPESCTLKSNVNLPDGRKSGPGRQHGLRLVNPQRAPVAPQAAPAPSRGPSETDASEALS